MRALLGVALAVVMAVTPVGPVWAETARAEVETTLEKGYGRLVLTFVGRNLIPQYTLHQNNGVVVLEFADPVEVSIDDVASRLQPYVTVARRDPEGRSLRIALARQVRVNTMEAGEKLFIDFLPARWTGAPPTLPQAVIEALAKRAEAAMKAAREAELAKAGTRIPARLDFKVGRLPTFTRFSFGWNLPFDTKFSRDGDRITLAFNRAAKIDFSSIDVQPVPGIVDVFADVGDDGLKIVFTLEPGTDVRGFRERDAYVLDVLHAGPAANTGEAMVRDVLGQPDKGRDRFVAPSASEAPVAAHPAGPNTQAATSSDHGAPPPRPASPQPVPQTSAPAPMPTVSAPAAPEPKLGVAETPLPPVAAPPPAAAPAAVAPPIASEVGTTTIELPTGERPPAFAPRRTIVTGDTIKAEVKRIGDLVRIGFPFAAPVPAAAFNRGDVLWVIFDSAKDFDVSAVAPNLGARARGVSVMRSKAWTALRIELAEPLLTTLTPDGDTWMLALGEMVLEPTKPLALRRFVRGDGNRSLKIDLADGGAVREFVDPVIGDRVVAVTALPPSRGLLKSQSFVDLDLLASAQGVALVPHGDDVQVVYENGEVRIERERGLSLSNGAVEDRTAPGRREQPRLHNVPIDPAAFEPRDAATFRAKSRELLNDVVVQTGEGRRQARLDLAEFYLGRRFAPEALAQLRLLADESPSITRDPGFMVLWGAGQVLAGRAKKAREALAHGEVAESADAALWRTIADTELAKYEEARENALRATGVLGAYPKSVQSMFNLAAAESAIEVNDLGLAQARLAEIEPDLLEDDLVGRFEIAQARLAERAGRPEDATARYERAMATGDRRVQAEAEYHVVRSLLKAGKIDKEQAIERMRSLAFGWRGDEVELRTLRFLAGLLADTGRYREAFQAMRSALQVAPDAPTTRLLQDEMGRRFLALYLDDADKALKPIDALTLYYDFRELVPIDRRGDELVRKLADRLVGVDLLPQAAELLSYQIDNRLKGAARAQIAADLALVHLIDHKPEKALAVLNKTRQSQLPASLERQRRLVEARALADAGRINTAIELLSTMSGPEAVRLKVDVLWKAKRWREAGERLEALLGARWQDALPLDDQERGDVLRVGIAYALANDQLSLDRLRQKFRTKMAASPQAHTFDVVTQPIQSQGTEFQDIAREIASVDTMTRFLQEYRTLYVDPKPAPPQSDVAPSDGKTGKAASPEASAEGPTKMARADSAAAGQ